jgi:hypothetical protein
LVSICVLWIFDAGYDSDLCKKVVPVRLGNVCCGCGECYEDKDIVRVDTYFMDRKDLCKNCFNIYSYKDIIVGNDVILVYKYRY